MYIHMYVSVCMYAHICLFVCLLVIYLPAEYIVEAHTDRRVRERQRGRSKERKAVLVVEEKQKRRVESAASRCQLGNHE